ncbi:MAG: YceI family protein [Pseudomonadota bacterium]|nr:YceI family protein [Pseudomonadota bacterium]
MLTAALFCFTCTGATLSAPAQAANYQIDRKGMHAFIEFRIQHLGYSWLYGRFNDFNGTFSWDRGAPEKSKAQVTIQTSSVDTNHTERDNHLRGDDFLNSKKHPQATFASQRATPTEAGFVLEGELSLNGVVRPVRIQVQPIGEGPDPWGGYRAGFIGTTKLKLRDFGIDYELGPASREVELTLSIEGVRQ